MQMDKIPFVVINISTESEHLDENEILCALEETVIKIHEIKSETVCKTTFKEEQCSSDGLDVGKEEIVKNIYTIPS